MRKKSQSRLKLKRALAINGWATRDKLAVIARFAQNCATIVEVGSFQGRSARAMIDNAPPWLLFFAVDTWAYTWRGGEIDDDDYSAFCANLADVNDRLVVLRMPSHEAAAVIEQTNGLGWADMVYLDGGHDYDTVKSDIADYLPLIRPGGLLCGDDYHPRWPGVMRAVKEAFGKVKVNHTIWQWKLPDGPA